MKIECWVFGKKNEKWLQTGIDDYKKRIQGFMSFEVREFITSNKSSKKSAQDIKLDEGNQLLNALKPNDHMILLDERGNQMSSTHFAYFLEKKLVMIPGRLLFVIGGAYGFSEEVYTRSNAKLALSNMTLPHQLARLIFLEQLYRAFSIINKHPYHHV